MDFSVSNIALGKPAIGSSVYELKEPDFLAASKATDGIKHQDTWFGSTFHSKKDYQPWWMVDLQGVYSIDHVVVINRMDCCGEQGNQFC